VAAWKLTVRNGSEVDSARFDDLDEAVASLRRRALAIRSEGPADAVSGLRDYAPGDQVKARLQITTGTLFSKRVAGVDVRGDGEFVPYRGGLRREELAGQRERTPFELVRETLEG
jgi:hypothetical protein